MKDGIAEATQALERARKAMAEGTVSQSNSAQAGVMINQAQQIVDAITKDGSFGVHAPSYTQQRIEEAKLLATVAGDIASGGAVKKASTKQ